MSLVWCLFSWKYILVCRYISEVYIIIFHAKSELNSDFQQPELQCSSIQVPLSPLLLLFCPPGSNLELVRHPKFSGTVNGLWA